MDVAKRRRTGAEETHVEANRAVGAALELHGAAQPGGVSSIRGLYVADRVAPGAVEGEGRRESERRAVPAERHEGGADLTRVVLPEEDEVDGVLRRAAE